MPSPSDVAAATVTPGRYNANRANEWWQKNSVDVNAKRMLPSPPRTGGAQRIASPTFRPKRMSRKIPSGCHPPRPATAAPSPSLCTHLGHAAPAVPLPPLILLLLCIPPPRTAVPTSFSPSNAVNHQRSEASFGQYALFYKKHNGKGGMAWQRRSHDGMSRRCRPRGSSSG